MIDCRFKPIEKWPGKPTASWARKAGSFKAGWQNTLDLLERELNHLKAKDISIEGYFFSNEIRNDGWPKSSARPTQPGVVLSFSTKKGRMTVPCDRYTGWESNLRAIALTLEHLRAVERYGVTTDEQEQYTGWLKLPAASAINEKTELAKILIQFANVEGNPQFYPSKVTAQQNLFDSVWREAVRRTHPDTGGRSVDFRKVIDARDRLKELNGW
jgi:hypothetical protein